MQYYYFLSIKEIRVVSRVDRDLIDEIWQLTVPYNTTPTWSCGLLPLTLFNKVDRILFKATSIGVSPSALGFNMESLQSTANKIQSLKLNSCS